MTNVTMDGQIADEPRHDIWDDPNDHDLKIGSVQAWGEIVAWIGKAMVDKRVEIIDGIDLITHITICVERQVYQIDRLHVMEVPCRDVVESKHKSTFEVVRHMMESDD